MQRHHNPKPSVIVQWYLFNTQNHCVGESVSTYVAELCYLSHHCEFGPSLHEMLRDRLVCSIEDPKIQWRWLAEPELTFKKLLILPWLLNVLIKCKGCTSYKITADIDK